MRQTQNIRYVVNSDIDRKKWNRCIDEAGGYPLYAYDFYLDAMSKHWDALVLNEYNAVMPLTWNKKWGIYYLYQPFLTPQLGIIGSQVNEETVQAFLSAVPDKFRFWEINLNTANDFEVKPFALKRKLNYFLPLQQPYSVIALNYRQNHIRNIKKATAAGCVYKENVPLQEVLHLAEQQIKQYARTKKDDLSHFAGLCNRLLQQKKAQTPGVFCNERLLSACVFFFHRHVAYYILAANNPESRRTGASHFLLDNFIKKMAGQNWVLDFEGSDIRSIAFFYEGFGAQPQFYTSVKLNRLPKALKWLK